MNATTVETARTEQPSHRTLRAVPSTQRRRFPRVSLSTPMPVLVGRVEAIAVDLSARGACVLHTSAFPRAAQIRLTFMCGTHECTATVRVVASRVIGLGDRRSTDPVYESHLALVEVPHLTEYLLARLLKRLAAGETGERFANASA